jgi:Abortive infection C-terminus
MMNRNQVEIEKFSRLVEPWLWAYRFVTRSFLAVRIEQAMRLCGGRVVFGSDIDSDPPEPFLMESESLVAGIETISIDESRLRDFLAELGFAPNLLVTNHHTFDLGDAARTTTWFDPLTILPGTGSRRTPGVRISCSEEVAPQIPHERVLDADVQAATPHFASIARLLARLGFGSDILRFHTMPHFDVIAPAPAFVTQAMSATGTLQVQIRASAALLQKELAVRGTLTERGKSRPLTLGNDQMLWRSDKGPGHVLTFDLVGAFDEVNVSLIHAGVSLDSCTVKADESTDISETPPTDIPIQRALLIAESLGHDQMRRDLAHLSDLMEEEPGDALRLAKEVIEACCKTVLERLDVTVDDYADLSKLVNQTLSQLTLVPADVSKPELAQKDVKGLVSALANLANRVGDLRNHYGAGHGKSASFSGLEPKHARLAALAAIAFVTFIGEVYLGADE